MKFSTHSIHALALCALVSAATAATAPVGSTPGSFAVNPSGAATYTIPIQVPPGVNGMQPEISLVYNSQAGNGLAGVGWSIGGLSAITRCGTTIDREGVKGGVNLDWNDRYCYGGKRLVAVSGTYGGVSTEYRTEIETFAKVVSYGSQGNGPAFFKVWTKAGQVIDYGYSNASSAYSAGNATALSWKVNNMEDAAGNQIQFHYSANSDSSGEHTLAVIEYTFNNGIPIGGVTRRVEFEYESRGDVETSFIGGGQTRQARRLHQIKTFFNGALVRDYLLNYETSSATGRSRLTGIQECVTDGTRVCLSTTFDYQVDSAERRFSEQGKWLSSWCGDSTDKIRYADFNGDGKTDIGCHDDIPGNGNTWVALSNGVNAFTGGNLWLSNWCRDDGDRFGTADFNGDDKADLWCRRTKFGDNISVALSNGVNAFDGGGIWMANGWCEVPRMFGFADFDGDGRADLWCHDPQSQFNNLGRTWVALSDGRSAFISKGIWRNGWCIGENRAFGTADFNGDGKADIWCRGTKSGDGTWVALSNGTDAFTGGSQWLGSWCTGDNDKFGIADFNADGKADLWCHDGVGSGNTWIALSDGLSSFRGGGVWLSNWCTNASFGAADFNGDGKTDIYCDNRYRLNEAHNTWVALSNGYNAFTGGEAWLGDGLCTHSDVSWGPNGDFNGDGKTDFACHDRRSSDTNNNGDTWVAVSGSLPIAPDRMSSITMGLGSQTTLVYKPLTDAAVYQKDQTAAYPMKDVKSAAQVVASYSESDGIGGINTTTFFYVGKKEHQRGRGNLGFRRIIETKPDGSIVNSQFAQSYPFIGQALDVEARASNGAVVSFTQNWLGALVLGDATSPDTFQVAGSQNGVSACSALSRYQRCAPFISQSKTWLNDLQGASLGWTNVLTEGMDRYGNASTVTTTTSDDFKRVSTNYYYPADLTNWRLGKLFAAKVDSTVPAAYSDTGLAQTQTRQSAFTYNANGLIEKEVTQPESIDSASRTYTLGALSLSTQFTYDTYGHRATTSVSGSDIVTRVTTVTVNPSITYDDGRPVMTATTSIPVTVIKKNSVTGLDENVVVTHTEAKKTDARYGVPTSLTGPNGRTTKWFYDGLGRKASEYRADGTSTHTALNDCGSAGCDLGTALPRARYSVTTTNKDANNAALDAPVTVYYDTLNRAIRTETQSFNGTTVYQDTNYDALGRAVRVSTPYFLGDTRRNVTTSYDALGRIRTVAAPDDSVTTTDYYGLTTTVTAPASNSDGYIRKRIEKKNTQGQLDTVTDALGHVITYKYDAFGNLVKVTTTGTDGKTATTTMSYNLRGFKTSMVDPDTGTWTYGYNVLGELTSQTDAKNQVTSMTYDELGRLKKRTESEGTSTWRYDTAPNAIGMLESVSGPTNGYTRGHLYDNVGRPTVSSTVIDGEAFYLTHSYDTVTGRLWKTTYPAAGGSNLTVYNTYNTRGYVEKVSSGDNGTGTVYWQVDGGASGGGRDAAGRLTGALLSNGVMTTRYTYNAVRGLLTDIDTTTGPQTVQDLHYDYYSGVPNLQRRTDHRTGRAETFTYDALNRLTDVVIQGDVDAHYTYDSLGNIKTKSDLGTYVYGSSRPHAVTSISISGAVDPIYTYDANGNQLNGGGRTLTYTGFNLPKSITTATVTTTFAYDADHARIKQVKNGETTVYLNARWDAGPHYERETKSNGTVEHKHYIYAPSGPMATHTVTTSGGTVTGMVTRYLHTDHLGSIDAITTESGSVIERFRYDAFGKQIVTQGTNSTTHHGYTGHEMLNDVNLIHMNGRVYDPSLGRFLQADPIVQFPNSLQSYNRYSYVCNNPLRALDPSGMAEDGECTQGGTDTLGCGVSNSSDTATADPWGDTTGINSTVGIPPPPSSGTSGGLSGAATSSRGVTSGISAPSTSKRRTFYYDPNTGTVFDEYWNVVSMGPGANMMACGVCAIPAVIGLPVLGGAAIWWAMNHAGQEGGEEGGGAFGGGTGDPCSSFAEDCSSSSGSKETTTLYRAVTDAELKQIRATGKFEAGPNSLGGKWFAESAQHARQWGSVMNGTGNSTILRVDMSKSAADRLMRMERLDGIGPARYGEIDQLRGVIIREIGK